MIRRTAVLIGFAAALLAVPGTGARTYKWVDEKGVIHYGDRVPPQYATPRTEKPVAKAPSPDETRAREQDEKRQLEQKRQDTALLATYASAREIDEARARELRRVQEWLARNSAGLAKSSKDADRRTLDNVLAQARKDTDEINARYDAQKARFLELKAGRAG